LYFHIHPVTLLLEILRGGDTDTWAVPHLKFLKYKTREEAKEEIEISHLGLL